MRKLFTLILVTVAAHSFSQDWPLKKTVSATKDQKVPFPAFNPFTFVAPKKIATTGTYQRLRLELVFLQ